MKTSIKLLWTLIPLIFITASASAQMSGIRYDPNQPAGIRNFEEGDIYNIRDFRDVDGFTPNDKFGKTGIMFDSEGNRYHVATFTLRKGQPDEEEHWWMTENLRVKTLRYRKPTEGSTIVETLQFLKSPIPNYTLAYCSYPDGDQYPSYHDSPPVFWQEIHGLYYNWAGAMTRDLIDYPMPPPMPGDDINIRGACPIGWHIPNIEEWMAFKGLMQEQGIIHDSGSNADYSLEDYSNNDNHSSLRRGAGVANSATQYPYPYYYHYLGYSNSYTMGGFDASNPSNYPFWSSTRYFHSGDNKVFVMGIDIDSEILTVDISFDGSVALETFGFIRCKKTK